MLRIANALNVCAVFCLICFAPPSSARQDDRTLPEFADGQAQRVEGFSDADRWIQHDLWVETEFDSDGDGRIDRMHVDVTRPEQTETEGLKLPVIYNTSPYFSGTGSVATQYMWNPRQELGDFPPFRESSPPIAYQSRRPLISQNLIAQWVPLGFIVVHSASPGTGLSDGCPSPGSDHESLAPKAVIDWLCGRARGFTTRDGDEEVAAFWCTGKVGMTGTSYNGTLSIAAASTGVEGLEAIIPVAPLVSYYRYYRSNGLVRHPAGYMGEDIDVIYDFIHSGDPEKREYCNENIRDLLLLEGFDRVTGDLNDFWDGRDFLRKLEHYSAATLMSHAFNDWNVMPEHSVLMYAALREKGVPCQAFFHQGGHGGPPPHAMMNRWFTRYLHGIENDVEKDPRSWIVREDASANEPTPYPDYPHPEAELVSLHPSASGLTCGKLEFAPVAGQEPETLVDDSSIFGASLAKAEHSENRLLFATSELQEPVHLSGTSRITVRLASSDPAVNLSVWIVSLPWTDLASINSNIITRGWADPQNHKSLRNGKPLKPGEFYEVKFDLQPDDQVIPAGARIGLMIFASDRDFTLWPEPGTHLTIDPSGTFLELSVVGGSAALQRATETP